MFKGLKFLFSCCKVPLILKIQNVLYVMFKFNFNVYYFIIFMNYDMDKINIFVELYPRMIKVKKKKVLDKFKFFYILRTKLLK